ncbi:glycoside hydrolase superfamily [Lipomyces starkeyi]
MARFASLFCTILGLLSAVTAVPTPQNSGPARRWLNFGYGHGDKVRGVNIGGWLVLEPYINLSLFRQFPVDNIPVDEYHFCQYLGKDECLSQLQAHWASWLSADDFAEMKAAGLNHVRIPIGYWAFQLLDSDPYVQGQIPYLDQALQWARQNGLKVWIDLHGVPGSQNGFDNSGLRDSFAWQTGANLEVTLNVMSTMIAKYAASEWNDVVVAIQPVNEPLGPVLDRTKIEAYYDFSYYKLRNVQGSDIALALHDAFYPTTSWNSFLQYPEFTHVILDHHAYQVFSNGEVARDQTAHLAQTCVEGQNILSTTLWTVVGEWSAAMTDCAEWLNGVYRGARYDGSYTDNGGSSFVGSCASRWDFSTWSETDKANSRQYIEAQMDAYEQGQGWIFWCWKTENAVEWDFSFLRQNGIIPQPLDSRQFPSACPF